MRRWLLHHLWIVPAYGVIWCLLWVIYNAATGRWWALAGTGCAMLINAGILSWVLHRLAGQPGSNTRKPEAL